MERRTGTRELECKDDRGVGVEVLKVEDGGWRTKRNETTTDERAHPNPVVPHHIPPTSSLPQQPAPHPARPSKTPSRLPTVPPSNLLQARWCGGAGRCGAAGAAWARRASSTCVGADPSLQTPRWVLLQPFRCLEGLSIQRRSASGWMSFGNVGVEGLGLYGRVRYTRSMKCEVKMAHSEYIHLHPSRSYPVHGVSGLDRNVRGYRQAPATWEEGIGRGSDLRWKLCWLHMFRVVKPVEGR
ncbi:hypothetical protein DFP72DRAFT_847340 [Ephemerocybe angulata]|uniref:Uncharacterized protein n=1 Tax=Ephemerocybe angulata TaxID=980116 RepID=A0A8H6I0D9_9AGAR|nr:hypothetical protein DFP72DRAFT_847340 [Tulosesus angulatus]